MSAEWGKTTAQEILPSINGILVSGKQQTVLAGLSTDSRKIGSDELFWALSGERYDGHDFIEDAVKRGAVGIVVQKDHRKAGDAIKRILNGKHQNPIVITVDDTLKALGDLAYWWRSQYSIPVVAITGSAGKTTAKEMTAGILELGNRTLKNKGNFNNLIGLPLSLLYLNKEYHRAVLEMGMNCPGEIARLTEIADPDVGVITNVGFAHLEGLGDLEGVARAKVELVEKISPKGRIVLNGDDELLMKTAAMFPREMVTFGAEKKNDVVAAKVRNLGLEGMSFILKYQGRDLPVKLRVPGFQNVLNALAAAAVGMCINEPPEHIVEGLSCFGGLKGRFMVSRLPYGMILVDDTYNANPSSLKAAIDSLESLVDEGKRKIVGLGEMMELGDATVFAHEEAGRMVAELGADCFLAMGEHANEMKKGAVAAGMSQDCVEVVETHSEMVSKIKGEIREGDLVFIKGSRKMALDKVVEGLNRKITEDN